MNFTKFILLILLLMPIHLASQIMPDTLINPTRLETEVYRSANMPIFKSFEVPAFLLVGSLVTWPYGDDFRALRNKHLPNFSYSYDEYLQYLPLAVMLGVKIGGVQGRSSWGEMLTADAFSLVLMTTIVNAIKYTAAVQRPNGGNYKAFPSGHTATAFMAATMLHKEYGHLSPWYSIGGYSVATSVALARILNNRHWMSDVLAGASIGIISVEVGYILSDLIFKKPKSSSNIQVDAYSSRDDSPSFIGVYTGINHILGMGTTSGSAGVEGAWFINPYMGIGGQITASIIPATVDDEIEKEDIAMLSGGGGAYFSYTLSHKWRIGSKALFSMDHAEKTMHYGVMTGLSLSYQSQPHLGIRIFTDYKYLPVFINNNASHILTVGASIEIML